ncbi:MAG: adenylate/guanylate cyclase domain-containing protein [Bacteroidota bacterium]|jgi:adenylate cyclase
MAIKDVLSEINEDVKDLLRMQFELTQTQTDYVPHDDDQGYSFESGKIKKGKLIETCVLYADIRNSTQLSRDHSKEVMAKLYTAFVSSVLSVAEHHGGISRNIIGDRVMLVFPQRNCFTNAIDTAISINTVASRIINKHFNGLEFKVGIGIDYGLMKTIKVGIAKQGKERAAYKNLVWIGNAANIASKLTDVANKEIVKTVYRVTRNPLNPNAIRLKSASGLYHLPIPDQYESVPGQPIHLTSTETVDLSPEEFADTISQLDSGKIFTLRGNMLKFKKEEVKSNAAPILMSQKVWEDYAKTNSSRIDVKENKHWFYQNVSVKEYSGKIIGGDVIWAAINDITL